jgi:hypothetical protein
MQEEHEVGKGVLSRAGLAAAFGLMALGAVGGQVALAQQSPSLANVGPTTENIAEKARLWELAVGTPITELSEAYGDPHCGTNGGPPSLRLAGWAEYAKCPPDKTTGLHEIWFTEDDELEYIGLALRIGGTGGGPEAANWMFNHKMIYSLLVDDAGTVQGYRIFTDPAEPPELRIDAYLPATAFLTLLGTGNFTCVQNPRAEGEQTMDGDYYNETCSGVIDGKKTTVDRHLFRKAGQSAFDPATQRATVGYFESSTRVEAVAVGVAGQ